MLVSLLSAILATNPRRLRAVHRLLAGLEQRQQQQRAEAAVAAAEAAGLAELIRRILVLARQQVVQGADEHRLRQRLGQAPRLALLGVERLPGVDRRVVPALGEL